MTPHDNGYTLGFMRGVIYTHDVTQVHQAIESVDRGRNRKIRVVTKTGPDTESIDYIIDPFPKRFLAKSIDTWWTQAAELGRIFPALQEWIWRDRECFLECAGHTGDVELLTSMLPSWPDNWALPKD